MGTQSGNRPLAGTMIAPFNTAGLNVCFTPKSGHWDSAARCPLCARSGCEQVHQIARLFNPPRHFTNLAKIMIVKDSVAVLAHRYMMTALATCFADHHFEFEWIAVADLVDLDH